MEVSVSNDTLGDALAVHMAEVTGGMLDIEVGGIFALDQTGHKFPITGIVIETRHKALGPKDIVPAERTTETGNRLRLASYEGERL